jgi:hypothetical protein
MSGTSYSAGAAAPGGFRVGTVFARAFEIYGRNFAKFFALTAIAYVPYFLLQIYTVSTLQAVQRNPGAVQAGSVVGAALGGVLLLMVLHTISEAAVIFGAFQEMRGRPFAIGDSLAKGLNRFLPIIALSFCIGIAMAVGFVLLIIPAFIFLAMLYVALPACVVERLGPFQSMGRSADLTSGHRWAVFGIAILLALINIIANKVIQLIFAAIGGSLFGVLGSFGWLSLFGAFSAIVVSVAYHDLRVVKEGIDVDRIAAVFD